MPHTTDNAGTADMQHQAKMDRAAALMETWELEDMLAETVELLSGPTKQ